MASQIFDPFGLVQPHALPVKRLMQQLCEMNLGWDDSIPEDLEATWHRWAQALPKLEDVTVPQCFMPLENAGSLELHYFSDACETGYGAVCYLRIASGSFWCCQFVIGKSRVAPLKALSIPRLELCAATLATKLAQLVSSQLRLDLEESFFGQTQPLFCNT